MERKWLADRMLMGALCIATVALTVFVSSQKPTSMVQAGQLEVKEAVDLAFNAQEREAKTSVEIYEAKDYDFALAVVATGEENSVLEGVCKELAGELESLQEERVKVYILSNLSGEEYEKVWELTKRENFDACIVLKQGQSEDKLQYGVEGVYNPYFYWEKLPVPTLGDVVLRNVAIATKNVANGLIEADKESELMGFEAPTIELVVGYVSNEKENGLMQMPEYQKKLANGLLEAIKELYKIKHEN